MAESLTFNLYRNPASGKLESGVVAAQIINSTLILSGHGFGVGPNIEVYDNWMSKNVGARAPKGVWDTALYGGTSADSYPLYQQLGDVTGISWTDDDTAMKGFVKEVGDFSDYFYAWQMGVPAGYYFSGASAVETFPNLSGLKMGWVHDQGLDSPELADLVSLSRVDQNNWAVSGNQTNVGLYTGGSFDWGKRNSFMTYHKSGLAPFVDNGSVYHYRTTNSGTVSANRTNLPVFSNLITLTPSVQNSSPYNISINGIAITTYTSDSDATLAEIRSGLIANINSSQTHVTAQNNFNNTKVSLIPNTTKDAIVTFSSANINVVTLSPKFTQLSTNWQGNGNQINCRHVQPYAYLAVGENCGNAIMLGTSDTFASNTDSVVLKPNSWTDSEISLDISTIPSHVLSAFTHWWRLKDGLPVQSGEI